MRLCSFHFFPTPSDHFHFRGSGGLISRYDLRLWLMQTQISRLGSTEIKELVEGRWAVDVASLSPFIATLRITQLPNPAKLTGMRCQLFGSSDFLLMKHYSKRSSASQAHEKQSVWKVLRKGINCTELWIDLLRSHRRHWPKIAGPNFPFGIEVKSIQRVDFYSNL